MVEFPFFSIAYAMNVFFMQVYFIFNSSISACCKIIILTFFPLFILRCERYSTIIHPGAKNLMLTFEIILFLPLAYQTSNKQPT